MRDSARHSKWTMKSPFTRNAVRVMIGTRSFINFSCSNLYNRRKVPIFMSASVDESLKSYRFLHYTSELLFYLHSDATCTKHILKTQRHRRTTMVMSENSALRLAVHGTRKICVVWVFAYYRSFEFTWLEFLAILLDNELRNSKLRVLALINCSITLENKSIFIGRAVENNKKTRIRKIGRSEAYNSNISTHRRHIDFQNFHFKEVQHNERRRSKILHILWKNPCLASKFECPFLYTAIQSPSVKIEVSIHRVCARIQKEGSIFWRCHLGVKQTSDTSSYAPRICLQMHDRNRFISLKVTLRLGLLGPALRFLTFWHECQNLGVVPSPHFHILPVLSMYVFKNCWFKGVLIFLTFPSPSTLIRCLQVPAACKRGQEQQWGRCTVCIKSLSGWDNTENEKIQIYDSRSI